MSDYNVMSMRDRAELDRHITGNYGEDSIGEGDGYYESFVDGLFVNRSEGPDGLMHAAVGIAGEAGEILDAVKKNWVYNKEIDVPNLIEELGDIEFYMQALRTRIGVTRDEVIERNIAKLQKRYPKGYTDAAAIARADKA